MTDMNDVYIVDIEADGLLDTVTKIHCLSFKRITGKMALTLTTYDGMVEWLLDEDKVICGHNFQAYDRPVIEKVLGISLSGIRIIDTLPLAWYVDFNRVGSYGLASYGEKYGVPKPVIENWEDQSLSDYVNRCEQDCLINEQLFLDQYKMLTRLYHDDPAKVDEVMYYLSSKMEMLRHQERQGWKLDVDRCQVLYDDLVDQKYFKTKQLIDVMPKRVLMKTVSPPKVMYKADGSLSSHGERWLERLDDAKLPHTTQTPITIIDGYEDANPGSIPQVKSWLDDLGWEPCTFKYTVNSLGEEKVVAQIRKDGELCDSVKQLIPDNPGVELLDGLTVLNHRIGVLGAMLNYHNDGELTARSHGLTNTFRFRHVKPLVNIPSVSVPYGKEIRECLIAREDNVLVGSDMVSLEDTTKRHYMYDFDIEYVEEMSEEGFDPHLDLAKFAGAVTDEQISNCDPAVKDIRKAFKVVNYSCVYGVGEKTLSRQSGMPVKQCKQLIEAYWDRNGAVSEAVSTFRTKTVYGSMWVQNPVSKFWHSLRAEKDKFSTVNQSTGVYCFDKWIAALNKRGIYPIAQFHDEVIVETNERTKDLVRQGMREAIKDVNNEIKLNVALDIDVQIGYNYAEIH